MHELYLSCTVILAVCRSFIRNKNTFTKYCLTQWILKLPGSFEIHWERQYHANVMGLEGIVNTTVYKTEPIITGLGYGKMSKFLLPPNSEGYVFTVVRWFVRLSVSSITEKRMNGFSWNFQDMLDPKHQNNWLDCFTPN